MEDASKYQQLSLSEAGQFDYKNNLKNKLTGWGRICKERAAKGVSRKARIQRRKQAA